MNCNFFVLGWFDVMWVDGNASIGKTSDHLECCGDVSGEDFGLEDALLVDPSEEAYFRFCIFNRITQAHSFL